MNNLCRAAVWVLLAQMPIAHAGDEQTIEFHIPSQTLSTALLQFSQASGIKTFFKTDLARNIKTKALNGFYTPLQALNQLLKNTGLHYRFTETESVTLFSEQSSMSTERLLAMAPGNEIILADATENDADLVEQMDMTVSGGDWSGYHVLNANTATKTEAPIMQTPMNVQVVPRSLMDDQQDIRITEALVKNVSGIQAFHGSGNIYENFYIRGFQTGNVYRNGLLRGFNTYDPANIEQLEVLKGPTSMLYGRTQPGGLINYVTKKGSPTSNYSLQQQIGSYDQYRTTLDATGPIDQAGELSYRLNLAYQDIGSFKQFVNDERYFLAPTLSWRPNDRFEANLELEYKHENKVDDWGIPSIGDRPAPVPLSRSYQDLAKGPVYDTTLVAYDWALKFTDNWKLTNRFLWENWDIEYFDIAPARLDSDNRTLFRSLVGAANANQETYATNLDLTGKFELLGSKHEILIGGDYYHNSFDNPGARPGPSPLISSVDIFNPVYHVVDVDALYQQPPTFAFLRREERFGIYFQDQITLFDKFHILGGGRYDWVTYGTGANGGSYEFAKASFNDIEDQKFSPRIGILYQPWEWLSLYGSYSESLGSANTGFSFTGESFNPQEGEQFEAGFKTELFDSRFSTTVSYFDLTKTNNTVSDPAHPGYSITAGTVRSRGIEVDIKGRITDKLNLVTTYAFTDIRYVKANPPIQGQREPNVPEHQASLWSTYQVTDHFKLGLGGIAVGTRQADFSNPVKLSGYVRMDMMAAYTLPIDDTLLTAQINVYNVLDKEYYQGAGNNRNSIITGEPISAMGLLRLQF